MFYGHDAYFTSGWNIMDGSLVTISIIDLLMSLISESSPRIFGILRVSTETRPFWTLLLSESSSSSQQSSVDQKTSKPDNLKTRNTSDLQQADHQPEQLLPRTTPRTDHAHLIGCWAAHSDQKSYSPNR